MLETDHLIVFKPPHDFLDNRWACLHLLPAPPLLSLPRCQSLRYLLFWTLILGQHLLLGRGTGNVKFQGWYSSGEILTLSFPSHNIPIQKQSSLIISFWCLIGCWYCAFRAEKLMLPQRGNNSGYTNDTCNRGECSTLDLIFSPIHERKTISLAIKHLTQSFCH